MFAHYMMDHYFNLCEFKFEFKLLNLDLNSKLKKKRCLFLFYFAGSFPCVGLALSLRASVD